MKKDHTKLLMGIDSRGKKGGSDFRYDYSLPAITQVLGITPGSIGFLGIRICSCFSMIVSDWFRVTLCLSTSNCATKKTVFLFI
jgi:hypothetical protein